MRFVDEYRTAKETHTILRAIEQTITRPWVLMEICGGQTHGLIKSGLLHLLPPSVTLIHGPGCPVCVTPVALIDQAIAIAHHPGVLFTSFGDMLRVPGSATDLLSVKATGGDVRIVYSPLDALKLAQQHPERQVVFFAVGFETTAPATAMAVWRAAQSHISNFSVLMAHVCVPPAMHMLLSSADNRVQGFLAAGHVCAVMGYWQYEPIAATYRVPVVVTGFEPLDLAHGIYMTICALEEARCVVENQYRRAVTREGNTAAQQMLNQVFIACDRQWRGIGNIPASGYCLAPAYAHFDAARRFEPVIAHISPTAPESPMCIAGDILQGKHTPPHCPAFATDCTPEHPIGAPMVSSEGACAAYYHYRTQTHTTERK